MGQFRILSGILLVLGTMDKTMIDKETWARRQAATVALNDWNCGELLA